MLKHLVGASAGPLCFGLLIGAITAAAVSAFGQGNVLPNDFTTWPQWAITQPNAVTPYTGYVPLVAADGSQMTLIPVQDVFTLDRNLPLANLAGGVGAQTGTFLQGSPSPYGSWMSTPSSSGAIVNIDIVSTGTSNTLSTLMAPLTVQDWTSTASGVKVQTIPGCTSAIAGYRISVADQAYSAEQWSYDIYPASGTIAGGAGLGINQTGASQTIICDGVSNWIPL